MNAIETISKLKQKDNDVFSLTDLKAHQHYKFLATVCNWGFPNTKAQAEFFVKNVCFTNRLLNSADIEKIEKLLNKHGFEGCYRLTKTKNWGRIQNGIDVSDAFRLEFNF
jgi:hypothetical protein